MPTNGEISLYFHIPFCTKKCDYCHFFVLPNKQEVHEEFVRTLLLEWELKKGLLEHKTIKSIYFGGGTPALLAPHYFEEILKKISFDPKIEITLEANPENLNLALLKEFRAAGINRLSIGAQAFDDELLRAISRTHDSKATILALEAAHLACFENVSIDLMYDLPNQSESTWIQTLKTALSLPITHLSLYNLTIEPETVFFKHRKRLMPTLPSPESSLMMYEAALELLPSGGLLPYEISAFAKNGLYSRHNTGYWTGRDFLGFGPSAYSYFGQNRFRNVPHFGKYQAALLAGLDPSEEPDLLTQDERRRELLAVELRLRQGVDLALFQKRHGPLEPITEEAINSLIQRGWINQTSQTIKLSQQGILFYDSVAIDII